MMQDRIYAPLKNVSFRNPLFRETFKNATNAIDGIQPKTAIVNVIRSPPNTNKLATIIGVQININIVDIVTIVLISFLITLRTPP